MPSSNSFLPSTAGTDLTGSQGGVEGCSEKNGLQAGVLMGHLILVTNLPRFEKSFCPNTAFSLNQAQISPDFSVLFGNVRQVGKIYVVFLCLDTACNSVHSIHEVLPTEGCLFEGYVCAQLCLRFI